ncbi:hypothetical protein [Curtobacterium sp. Leaf261]|uniref:hypothetical protein n=1 Tax=Curtobacterium sp. Leaf261 TaxID=1736311 RepID=UPI0006FAD4E4|nr:hypothetical protein [Curtobacterium sp. Leaf261]KQO60352.1 hypothetical protein ASF23_14110 [Curtobacterium sp. Leaf261]
MRDRLRRQAPALVLAGVAVLAVIVCVTAVLHVPDGLLLPAIRDDRGVTIVVTREQYQEFQQAWAIARVAALVALTCVVAAVGFAVSRRRRPV